MFLLTHGQPTLLREITTPAIAPFATSCLNNVTLRGSGEESNATDVHNPLLHTILQSLIKLLPNHPSSFRPFINRIRTLLAPLLAPTFSNLSVTAGGQVTISVSSKSLPGLAQRLHALLPNCAARTGSSEEWSKYVRLLLDEVNRTANYVFRGVVESHIPEIIAANGQGNANGFQDEINDASRNELLLPAWQGIYAGCERLIGLLQLLQAYLATKTAASISIPVGTMTATLERVLSVFAPEYSHTKGIEMQFNPEVSRDERDGMYSMLPELHTAAIGCFSTLMARLSQNAMSLIPGILDLISWLFQRTRTTFKSTTAFFNISTQIVELIGPSITSNHFEQLAPILRQTWVVFDLQENESKQRASQTAEKSKAVKSVHNNADSFTNPHTTVSKAKKAPKRLLRSALKLMSTSMAVLPTNMITGSMRREMDRAAVLLRNEEVLLASILNPGTSHMATLLPFLSRMHPSSLSTEALLNPRLPPVRRQRGLDEDDSSDDEQETALTSDPQEHVRTLDLNVQHRSSPYASLNDMNAAMISKEASESGQDKDNKEHQHGISKISQSLESAKRTREPESLEAMESTTTTTFAPDSKRPRLEPDELPNPSTKTEDIGQDRAGLQKIFGATDSPPPVAKSSANIPRADDSDTDSNGSFEIPPIVLESDTEEEEDEDLDDIEMDEETKRQLEDLDDIGTDE